MRCLQLRNAGDRFAQIVLLIAALIVLLESIQLIKAVHHAIISYFWMCS